MCLNFITSEPYETFLAPKVFQTTVGMALATEAVISKKSSYCIV